MNNQQIGKEVLNSVFAPAGLTASVAWGFGKLNRHFVSPTSALLVGGLTALIARIAEKSFKNSYTYFAALPVGLAVGFGVEKILFPQLVQGYYSKEALFIVVALVAIKLFSSEAHASNREFYPIIPFNPLTPLEKGVQSDHTEVAIKIGDFVLNSWNISNPFYHCYFGSGTEPPFKQSHLYVKEPFDSQERMDSYLAEKELHQVGIVADRLNQKTIDVQVVIEGYENFYQELTRRASNIEIIRPVDTSSKRKGNLSGIVVNKDKFNIIESDVIYCNYSEEQDNDQPKKLSLPYALLKDKQKDYLFAVVAVHIPGCSSQYPKTGLERLAQRINELQVKIGSVDIIAMGDYNTPFPKVRRDLSSKSITVLEPPYLTHVNPSSNAAKYDLVAIKPGKGSQSKDCKMLPAEALCSASQDLIKSINRNLK